MKKVILSISILSTLLFLGYACGKKDEPNPGTNSSTTSTTGTTSTTATTTSGSTTSTTAGTTTSGTTSGSTTAATTSGSTTSTTSETNSDTYKALLKGTWTTDSDDDDICDAGDGLYIFDNTNKYTVKCPTADLEIPYTYSISADGKTLTLPHPLEARNINYTVEELTSTKLVISSGSLKISFTKKQ